MKPEHTTFVIERELPGRPRHAFRFWAELDLKEIWTGCHADWTVLEQAFDFRPGGIEIKRWRTPEGKSSPSVPTTSTSSPVSGSSTPMR